MKDAVRPSKKRRAQSWWIFSLHHPIKVKGCQGRRNGDSGDEFLNQTFGIDSHNYIQKIHSGNLT